MTIRPEALDCFRNAVSAAALVRIEHVAGSTPREAGAWMLVSPETTMGTIGGGQLEYLVIDATRAMLARGRDHETLDIPLGPEIGQCCGGRTRLSATRLDGEGWNRLRTEAEDARRAYPEVYVFGAGHVGRALSAALALLPVRTTLIDQRVVELQMAPHGIDVVLTPLPEEIVRLAAPGSAFVILTYDHALDFLIAREALLRGDASYVGMIGSRTKRVQFQRWLDNAEGEAVSGRALVCPIGAAGRPDKRPSVIAAFVATEILARLAVLRQVATAG